MGTGHQVSAGCVWPSPLGCVCDGSEVWGWDHDLGGPSRLWAQLGVKDMGRDEVGGNGGPSAPRKSLHLLFAPPAQGPWRDWKKTCGPHPSPLLLSSFCLHLSALITPSLCLHLSPSLPPSPSTPSLPLLTLIFICGIFGCHGKPKKEVSVPFKTSAFFPPPSLLLSPTPLLSLPPLSPLASSSSSSQKERTWVKSCRST